MIFESWQTSQDSDLRISADKPRFRYTNLSRQTKILIFESRIRFMQLVLWFAAYRLPVLLSTICWVHGSAYGNIFREPSQQLWSVRSCNSNVLQNHQPLMLLTSYQFCFPQWFSNIGRQAKILIYESQQTGQDSDIQISADRPRFQVTKATQGFNRNSLRQSVGSNW